MPLVVVKKIDDLHRPHKIDSRARGNIVDPTDDIGPQRFMFGILRADTCNTCEPMLAKLLCVSRCRTNEPHRLSTRHFLDEASSAL